MSVISVDKDYENLAIIVVADFDASVEQVWELWADPRKLECWWAPPTFSATFERHDLSPGGEVLYYMTAPDGQRHYGYWRITSADPPKSMDFTDGFADANGTPSTDMPVSTCHLELFTHNGGTRMELRSTSESREQLEQLVNMGAVEGLRGAIGQMDGVLAAA
jgi:uncharacterized protein YndB with AHSA1/START domain